jgi:hypothetical protein
MINSIVHNQNPAISFTVGEKDPCATEATLTQKAVTRGTVSSIGHSADKPCYDVHFGTDRHILLPATMYRAA